MTTELPQPDVRSTNDHRLTAVGQITMNDHRMTIESQPNDNRITIE